MDSFTIKSFIKHRFLSRRRDAFHSPYLFELFTFCCDDKTHHDAFLQLESWRNQLLKNNNHIVRTDHGKGSSYNIETKKDTISSIARHALSLPYQCRFMARLAEFQNAQRILEFGTSLGISAGYLQAINKQAIITTIEGDPEIAKIAMQCFSKLPGLQIQLVVATFADYLSATAKENTPIDILFLDGHHEANALLEYFTTLKNRFTQDTIVIVDDIYWSMDMHEGWRNLCAMEEVTQSVDCFSFGLLFFRKAFNDKEHHTIRFPLRSLLR